MKNYLLGLIFCFGFYVVSGQSPIQPKKIDQPPILDGQLDDPLWDEIPVYDDFWQQFPLDSIRPQGRTTVQMAYDDSNIYVGVKCFSKGNDFIITSLRRDFSFRFQDNVTLVLDTYADNNIAFVFGINALGARREALISNGGQQISDFQSSWDNKWFGETATGEDYWTAEFVIPFNTVRFTEGSDTWFFNLYRNDTQFNEYSTYAPIPRNRMVMDLNFSTPIKWEEPLHTTGTNVSLIPYVTGGLSRDYEGEPNGTVDGMGNVGFDAKIGVTPGLNLDLTVNPDFSQVEVDQQVTNLDRFEIFFPERRQFFLENSDLFGSFGLTRVNPFFSRRIGVARDTTTGQNIQNPIYYGARLSGKVTDDFRIGILNMQTAAEEENGIPSFNYSVAALQHKIFDRSNIAFIMVNKQAFKKDEFGGDFSPYNRVAGLEYRLASANNFWRGKTFYHRAFLSEKMDHSFAHGAQVEYIRRNYRLEWAHNIVGNGFDAQVGFVPRKDYVLISPEFQLFFYPNNEILNTHSINIDTRWFYQIGKSGTEFVDPYDVSEQQVEINWEFNFTNTSQIQLSATRNFLILLRDLDPTRVQEDGIFLNAGTEFNYWEYSVRFNTDRRRLFSAQLNPVAGGFFDGSRWGISGDFNYRIQPYGSISLAYNYNDIQLGGSFERAQIWLLGPKFDISFTKNLFLTSFFQYNSQFDNLNINTRFQWRFAPVSDFFLVYTDNYLTTFGIDQLERRNRAIVAKLTYWLNL